MPGEWTKLGAVDPTALIEARLTAHNAVQWVTRAARANLVAKRDDSHSNLGWDDARSALGSHPLKGVDGKSTVAGLGFDPLRLFLAQGSKTLGDFALDGCSDAEAGRWIDGALVKQGLKPAAAVTLPYALPVHPIAGGARYAVPAHRAEFAELAGWYGVAVDLLEETRAQLAAVKPGPSPVRCWPHHFDVATLVTLRAGDAETAPSIGIGMSPGDDYYPQPYFYVSPWPRPAATGLPGLPPPGHWHSKDFVSAVVTGVAVLAMPDRRAVLRHFIDAAVQISRSLLKA